jgi:hypothetical protein
MMGSGLESEITGQLAAVSPLVVATTGNTQAKKYRLDFPVNQ